MASSDLVNMGISVVSYTLKDIHDDQVGGRCPLAPLLLALRGAQGLLSPTGLPALPGEGSDRPGPKGCTDWRSGGQARCWDSGEGSGPHGHLSTWGCTTMGLAEEKEASAGQRQGACGKLPRPGPPHLLTPRLSAWTGGQSQAGESVCAVPE